jgi:hypothetical protein
MTPNYKQANQCYKQDTQWNHQNNTRDYKQETHYHYKSIPSCHNLETWKSKEAGNVTTLKEEAIEETIEEATEEMTEETTEDTMMMKTIIMKIKEGKNEEEGSMDWLMTANALYA